MNLLLEVIIIQYQNLNSIKWEGFSTLILKAKKSIEIAIEKFDFSNIWRVFNGNTMHFTWPSSSKPYIFVIYDCFLTSNSLANTVCDSKMIFLVLN